MRVIEFRGRCKDTGKVIPFFSEEYPIDACNSDIFIAEQFTGLTDKNGVKIFEGDIVAYGDGIATGGGDWDEFVNRGVIVWDNEELRWDITNKNQIDMDNFLINEDYEVLGNIHDNPKLLEKDEYGVYYEKI